MEIYSCQKRTQVSVVSALNLKKAAKDPGLIVDWSNIEDLHVSTADWDRANLGKDPRLPRSAWASSCEEKSLSILRFSTVQTLEDADKDCALSEHSKTRSKDENSAIRSNDAL